jgi:hypothetical protein
MKYFIDTHDKQKGSLASSPKGDPCKTESVIRAERQRQRGRDVWELRVARSVPDGSLTLPPLH